MLGSGRISGKKVAPESTLGTSRDLRFSKPRKINLSYIVFNTYLVFCYAFYHTDTKKHVKVQFNKLIPALRYTKLVIVVTGPLVFTVYGVVIMSAVVGACLTATVEVAYMAGRTFVLYVLTGTCVYGGND